MSVVLLIWLVFSVVFEHLLVVAALDIKVLWKKVLYYAIVGPYRVLIAIREWVGKRGWFEKAGRWFKA